jgi:hypothetical protein
MARLLRVLQGDVKSLAEETGYSTRSVSLALKGATNAVAARKIRALAIVKYHAKVCEERDLTPAERLEELGMEE